MSTTVRLADPIDMTLVSAFWQFFQVGHHSADPDEYVIGSVAISVHNEDSSASADAAFRGHRGERPT